MAITTYTELVAAVGNWLTRSDLTARAPEFIALAEAQMARKLRVRRMIERATATISDPYSAQPSDFLELVSMQMAETDGSSKWTLDKAPQAVIDQYETSSETGQPRFVDVVGEEFRYFPPPDQAYEATNTYYAKPPPLTASNQTNWLLTDHPDAYLFGALKEAGPLLRDPETLAVYSAKFDEALRDIRAADKKYVGTLRTDVPLSSYGAGYDIRRDV